MSVFSNIKILDEADLDQDFVARHGDLLSRNVRGFGYWIWKPQVILQCLPYIPDMDFLVYLDAGCHLNVAGRKRLLEYFSIVSQSKTGILAFDLVQHGVIIHREEQWTKADIFEYFGVTSNDGVRKSAQIEATVIVIQKRASTHVFFEKWLNIMQEHPSLVDDSVSVAPNDTSFVENRHDQSIFSLLGKLEKITLLPHEENFPRRRTRFAAKPAWRDLKTKPVHAKRDKSRISTHVYRDALNGFKFIFLLRFIRRLIKNN